MIYGRCFEKTVRKNFFFEKKSKKTFIHLVFRENFQL